MEKNKFFVLSWMVGFIFSFCHLFLQLKKTLKRNICVNGLHYPEIMVFSYIAQVFIIK